MLIVLAVILFVFSTMNGAWTRTPAGASLDELIFNIFCGVLSIGTGFGFCLLVMFLMGDRQPVELHGYTEHAALMIGGCAPGLLGLLAGAWVKKKTAQLRAEQSAEEA